VKRSVLLKSVSVLLSTGPSVICGAAVGRDGTGRSVIAAGRWVYGGGVAFGAFVKVMSIGTSNLPDR